MVLKSPRARGRNLEQILQEEGAFSIGKLLVEEGLITQQDLLAALAKGLEMPPINLSRYSVDPALAQFVPEHLARQYKMVPVSKIGNRLSVAMADPLNVLALDDITRLTSLEVSPLIADEKAIDEVIRQLYRGPVENPEQLAEVAEGEPGSLSTEAEEEVVDLTAFGMAFKRAPIMKVVDMMITDALKARASDIHLEPYEKGVRVRYRIDGNLVEAFQLPKKNQNAIVTRLKIMARLDITENRLPQDGRFKVRFDHQEIDFRVSVLPISFGNKVVMRLLDKSNLSVGLDQLGFLPDSLEQFRKAVSRPYGLILVTGPTGSGKSTTLYSVLNQLNEPGRNILTVEDPVEYQLDGVTQVQVNPEIGLTFASALRAFLRQAPDVVLVGEIRDGETADIAIKASLTGQIVLATLHTNDAPSAVSRLIDMGADPFLLASSLVFVAAQRLCRQICSQCKHPDPVQPQRLSSLGITLRDGTVLCRGIGCAACRKTGFRGRFAILEGLTIDDSLREMIVTKRPPDELKHYALAHGMRTLRQEGLEHLLAGRTTLDEVLRVTGDE